MHAASIFVHVPCGEASLLYPARARPQTYVEMGQNPIWQSPSCTMSFFPDALCRRRIVGCVQRGRAFTPAGRDVTLSLAWVISRTTNFRCPSRSCPWVPPTSTLPLGGPRTSSSQVRRMMPCTRVHCPGLVLLLTVPGRNSQARAVLLGLLRCIRAAAHATRQAHLLPHLVRACTEPGHRQDSDRPAARHRAKQYALVRVRACVFK